MSTISRFQITMLHTKCHSKGVSTKHRSNNDITTYSLTFHTLMPTTQYEIQINLILQYHNLIWIINRNFYLKIINKKMHKLLPQSQYLVTPRYMELLLPAMYGDILLIRSLPVHPSSFAFLKPLYRSLATVSEFSFY